MCFRQKQAKNTSIVYFTEGKNQLICHFRRNHSSSLTDHQILLKVFKPFFLYSVIFHGPFDQRGGRTYSGSKAKPTMTLDSTLKSFQNKLNDKYQRIGKYSTKCICLIGVATITCERDVAPLTFKKILIWTQFAQCHFYFFVNKSSPLH